jgi:predicted molibdopterin-dependent oxidoreductase YjgC
LITLTIDKTTVSVPEGTTVAAAILNCGNPVFRKSISGQFRGPVCGMGICFECRVTINGRKHQRSCTTLAADGMEIETEQH